MLESDRPLVTNVPVDWVIAARRVTALMGENELPFLILACESLHLVVPREDFESCGAPR